MIVQRPYPVEPWSVSETALDLGLLAQSESLFALSNGHIGLRGNLDEGEPFGIPGTYLNSFYEQRPLPYAEAGYGYPESGQTLIDVTNGKLIRLLVDDAPFDIRYGDVHQHHRRLDLRAGMLERSVDWTSPGETRVKVRSRRLVSFVQRAVAAVEYVVEPVEAAARIIVQSELVANEQQPALSGDPRVAAVLQNPLEAVAQDSDGHSVVLLHRTRASRLLMGAGMGHVLEAPGRMETEVASREDWARLTVACTLQPGEQLRLVKLIAYGWSSLRSETAVRDQVASALSGARFAGWDGLAQPAARVPRRLLGRRRRRGRGERRAPAGGPVRAVPRAAGRRARRAAGHPVQGADRTRVRRAHVLGQRDVRAAGPDVHAAQGRR